MEFLGLVFFVISLGVFISGVLIFSSRNPVLSILYLVLVFCGSSCFLLVLKLEFLGVLVLIIYAGAIAILFFFIVMMLNIHLIELREQFLRYLPIGSLVCILLLSESILLAYVDLNRAEVRGILFFTWIFLGDATYNVGVLGQLLYTFYSHLFVVAGLVLLLALVGSIVLTQDQKVNVELFRRQDLFAQVGCQESGLFLWLVMKGEEDTDFSSERLVYKWKYFRQLSCFRVVLVVRVKKELRFCFMRGRFSRKGLGQGFFLRRNIQRRYFHLKANKEFCGVKKEWWREEVNVHFFRNKSVKLGLLTFERWEQDEEELDMVCGTKKEWWREEGDMRFYWTERGAYVLVTKEEDAFNKVVLGTAYYRANVFPVRVPAGVGEKKQVAFLLERAVVVSYMSSYAADEVKLSHNVRLYRRLKLRIEHEFGPIGEEYLTRSRQELRVMLMEREYYYIDVVRRMEELRNYVYLNSYSVLSVLISCLYTTSVIDARRGQFKVGRGWLEGQRGSQAEARRFWRDNLRGELGKREFDIRLELMRDQELDDKSEKFNAKNMEGFGKLIESAYESNAVRHRELFKQYMEKKLDHFYMIYVLESGREGNAWLEEMRNILERERSRAPSVAEGLKVHSKLQEHADLYNFLEYTPKAYDKLIREKKLFYEKFLTDPNSAVVSEKKMPVGVWEDADWERVYKDVKQLYLELGNIKGTLISGGIVEGRTVLLKLLEIEDKLEEVEAQENRSQKKGGVQPVNIARSSFLSANWVTVQEIIGKGDALEAIYREMSSICLPFVKKFDGVFYKWLSNSQRRFNKVFADDFDAIKLATMPQGKVLKQSPSQRKGASRRN